LLENDNVWIAMENGAKARDILGANGIVDDYCIIAPQKHLEWFTIRGHAYIQSLVIGESITGIPAYFEKYGWRALLLR